MFKVLAESVLVVGSIIGSLYIITAVEKKVNSCKRKTKEA